MRGEAVVGQGFQIGKYPHTEGSAGKKANFIAESFGLAESFGAKAEVEFNRVYPATVNDEEATELARAAASAVVGEQRVEHMARPTMGGEDFSYMLNARPGAFIFMGNGDTAGLHNAAYDFNDEAIPFGTSYWVRLAESALAG